MTFDICVMYSATNAVMSGKLHGYSAKVQYGVSTERIGELVKLYNENATNGSVYFPVPSGAFIPFNRG